MKDELKKLIGRTIYCIYSNHGCRITARQLPVNGVAFHEKISIVWTRQPGQPKIDAIPITDIIPSWQVDTNSDAQNWYSINIKERHYDQSIDAGYHAYGPGFHTSSLYLGFIQIKKIQVMGYDINLYRNDKGFINTDSGTTENILLIHDQNGPVVLIGQEDILMMYVTNDINEIYAKINHSKLLSAYSIE